MLMDHESPVDIRKRQCDEVPGLLFGDFFYVCQHSRQNEADTRLILKMAMTGVIDRIH